MARIQKKEKEFEDELEYRFFVSRTEIRPISGDEQRCNTNISVTEHRGRLKKYGKIHMQFLSNNDGKIYTVMNDYVEGTPQWNKRLEEGTLNAILDGSSFV